MRSAALFTPCRSLLVNLLWVTLALLAAAASGAEDSQTLPLGPIGAGGRLSSNTNSIRVTSLTNGAPGMASGLLVNDHIHGAFGQEFATTGGAGITGAELDLGLAIERTEASGRPPPHPVLPPGIGHVGSPVNLPAARAFGPA